MRIEASDMKKKKKSKGITKSEKKTITCNIGTTQCENETVKYEKKIREPPNKRKELLHVILKLHNMRMEPLNVRKKIKRTTQCDKTTITCEKNRADAMLVLFNITIEPLNLGKK